MRPILMRKLFGSLVLGQALLSRPALGQTLRVADHDLLQPAVEIDVSVARYLARTWLTWSVKDSTAKKSWADAHVLCARGYLADSTISVTGVTLVRDTSLYKDQCLQTTIGVFAFMDEKSLNGSMGGSTVKSALGVGLLLRNIHVRSER